MSTRTKPTRTVGARTGRRRRPAAARQTARVAGPRLDLEAVGGVWASALDAADSGLRAAAGALDERELRELAARLTRERAEIVLLLERVAREERVPVHLSQLLRSRAGLRRLLGLPTQVAACVFDVEGVLIGSAALHAAAWAETFDELILARLEQAHGRFEPVPFDRRTDYRNYLHGKPRLDGVRAFLASRGISLPTGKPDDPPGAETVYGLANRKRNALLRRVEEHGVAAYGGSRRYLELARDAGLGRAVVSASASTQTLLERAGMAHLVGQRIDGEAIVAGRLAASPAPDILLAACRLLDVEPGRAAAFETSRAGVAAARAAGFRFVVGVDGDVDARELREAGADLVVPGLADLLELGSR